MHLCVWVYACDCVRVCVLHVLHSFQVGALSNVISTEGERERAHGLGASIVTTSVT